MSNSPPHPIVAQRKQSIVERASSALESKLGGTSIRRVASSPSGYIATANGDEPTFSMLVDDYELGPPIGYGSSAVVYIAKYKPLNKTVSIKMIDLDMFERNQIDELRREIQIMSLSKHPNLLPVYGSFVHGAKLYIVTPFLSAGSCLDIMKTAFTDGFDEASIATILRQALEGLSYLHKNGLIHRDVKAGNLLMDEDGLVQLADFGVSSSLMDTGERKGLRKTFVGTPCWMAPEVMEQSGYDYKADIWSFGITSLELATGHAPFAKYPPLKVLMLTLQNDPPTLDRETTKHKYSKAFKEMIDMCLVKDPAKRPTAEKLLQHKFFKDSVKKRQYLVNSILHNLPPITQRQHHKRHQGSKEEQHAKGVSWDFGSAGEDSDGKAGHRLSVDSTERESVSSRDSTTGRGVSFAPVGGDQPPSLAPAQRKSRFIVDSPSMSSPSGSSNNLVNEGPAPPTSQGPERVTTPSASTPTSSTSSVAPGEVRKGRFSVNQQSSSSISTGNLASIVDQNKQTDSPVDFTSPRSSDESLAGTVASLERKTGRFAVSTLSQQGSSPTVGTLEGRPSTSRFTVTTESPSQSQPQPPVAEKRTRFEISGADQSLLEPLEALQRQNEQQRQVLESLIAAMGRNGITPAQLGVSIPSSVLNPPVVSDVVSNGPSHSGDNALDRSMSTSSTDSALQRENESLKAEVERLRSELQQLKQSTGAGGGSGQ
ncbi:hypothetical protein HK104_003987 [Borealophlyctis nickersoniae]|nr:hypothetical protein HK104_003987 [Borealophlyctis nickersoniae]